jgi:DNA repair ATPase RecN
MDAAITSRIAEVRRTVNQINQRNLYETNAITRLHNKLGVLEKDKLLLLKAVALIDRTIAVISANGIGKIESIVTGGLHAVWGKESKLRFVIEKKETARGYSYELKMSKGDFTGKIMESFGGSVQNVVAFLLRVIMLKRFKMAKLLVLDENFANVGNEKGHHYLEKTSAMLRELCDNHGFTIMAVSHQPILSAAADQVYRLVAREDEPPLLRKLNEDERSGSLGNAFDEADKTKIAG